MTDISRLPITNGFMTVRNRIDDLDYKIERYAESLENNLNTQIKQKERLIKRRAWKHPRNRR